MQEPKAIVFVVDDDVSVREALGSLLRSADLRVETFASAQEFLAGPRPYLPSCLVLDVRLPGLSGLDLQKRMAEINVEIPIIFITGYGDVPMSVRAMKAGAVEFLTKPFDDRELLAAIQHAIGRARSARQQQEEIRELRGRYALLTPRGR
jgi:FixJ family two-component response regulator